MAATKPKRRAITQDDLYDVRYVSEAVFSPDGLHAAYVLAEVEGKGDTEAQRFSIWLAKTDGTGRPRRLTRGKGNSYLPRFTPDGRELCFLSSRDAVPQIYAMPLDGGEPEQITDLPQGAGAFEISPDGRSFVFAALAAPPPKPDENAHARIDRFWYRFDPIGGYLDDARQSVFLQTRGGKAKVLSDQGGLVLAATFSPDGRRLAILRTGLPHHKIFDADLSVLDLQRGGREKTLIERFGLMTAAWSADGRHIL